MLPRELVKRLKPGQSIQFDTKGLEQYYPERYHNGCLFTPADNLMEEVVGACYEFSYTLDRHNRSVTFKRLEKPLEEGECFSYVSPDHRHLVRFDPLQEVWRYKDPTT